jgi:hypothetical protein
VPVLPLDYGLRAPSKAGSWAAFFARIVAGFIGYIVLSLAWARGAVALRLDGGVVFLGWLILTVGLLWLAMYVRTRYGRPGYGYGILLVFVAIGGIILLIIGLCWQSKW